MATTKELRERRGSLQSRFKEIIDKAEAEDRDLTAKEETALKEINKDDLALKNRIDRQEEFGRQSEEMGKPIDRRVGVRTVGSEGDAVSRAGQFRFVDSYGVEHRAVGPKDSFARPEDFEGSGAGPANIGRILRAAVTGRPDLVPEGFQNAVSGSGNGGILLSPWIGITLVDYARARSVCIAAGAQTVRMDSREMTIVRLLNDPSPQWRAEGDSVAISDMSLGAFKMEARTLAVRVPMTAELLEDSSNADQLIIGALTGAMGAAMDQACLAGPNFSFFPGGILSAPGTNVQSGVGAVADYSKFSTAIGSILGQNFPGEPSELAWIKRPSLAVALDKLTATDSGQPLQPTPMVAQLKQFHTTGIEAGTSVVGDFRQLLIGMRSNGIRMQVTQGGNDADGTPLIDKLMLQLICYLRMDVAVLRPGWFSILKGISEA